MQNRRQFLAIAGAGLGLVPLVGWLGRSEVVETSAMGDSRFPVQATEAEWRAALTPEQFRVLRSNGTERPFTSALNAEKRRGTFVCAACGQPLFSSAAKYDSRTGWPSFFSAARQCCRHLG